MLVIQCPVYVFLQKTAWTEINMHLPAEVFVYIWRETDFGKHLGKVTGLFFLFLFFFFENQDFFNTFGFLESSASAVVLELCSHSLKLNQFIRGC